MFMNPLNVFFYKLNIPHSFICSPSRFSSIDLMETIGVPEQNTAPQFLSLYHCTHSWVLLSTPNNGTTNHIDLEYVLLILPKI